MHNYEPNLLFGPIGKLFRYLSISLRLHRFTWKCNEQFFKLSTLEIKYWMYININKGHFKFINIELKLLIEHEFYINKYKNNILINK